MKIMYEIVRCKDVKCIKSSWKLQFLAGIFPTPLKSVVCSGTALNWWSTWSIFLCYLIYLIYLSDYVCIYMCVCYARWSQPINDGSAETLPCATWRPHGPCQDPQSHLSCLCGEARIWSSRSRLGSSDRGFNWPRRSFFSGSPKVINGRWVMKAGSLGSPWRSKHQSFKDTPWWKSFIDCIIKSSLIVFDCTLIARAVLASAAEGLVGFHPWRSLVTKNLN